MPFSPSTSEYAMRNIELKALLHDRVAALRVCDALDAIFQDDIRQVDTYFRVPEGRLKLRESEPGDDYLVFYRRPDLASTKACDYTLTVVSRSVKRVLTDALGVLAVVTKVRTLYLWENVRIHLDRVDGLGEFIEFEAVLTESHDDADGHAKLARLRETFAIAPGAIRAFSYVDMVLGLGGE